MIIIPTNINFSKKMLELGPLPIFGYDFYIKKMLKTQYFYNNFTTKPRYQVGKEKNNVNNRPK